MKQIIVRSFAVGLACIGTLVPLVSGAQPTFPTKPIKIIVPYPPGGGTDVIARAIGLNMSRTLNVPIIVENKPGAGSMIGTSIVAKAAPDGYTLLVTTSSPMVVNPAVYKKLTYNVLTDFSGVSQISEMSFGIAVRKDFPANDLAGFIAEAKKRPKGLSFGSTGLGSAAHILGEVVNRREAIDVIHIPYQGSAPAINDLLGGQVSSIYADIVAILSQVDAGKLKVLAMTGAQRSRPDMPTFQEQGITGIETSWIGMFAPAGTPRAIIDKLSAEVASAVRTKEVHDQLVRAGMTPVGSSAVSMDATVRSGLKSWANLVNDIGGVSLE